MFGGKKKKILAEGVQASAVVLNVRDTGVTVNNNPRVKLTLQVRPDGQAPFEAEKAVTVSRVSIPRPGDQFIVRYSPDDPNRIEFDTAAVAAANAGAEAQQAQAVANQLPADLAANGVLGRGALIDVQAAPGGQLVNCQLTIGVRLVDGTPMYRATCGLSVTSETAQQLIPLQTILTVRADPANHQRIAVSLGEPTPWVVLPDAQQITDPRDRALTGGMPCQVQIVACAEQFLRLPTGEDVFTTKLRVLDDGSEVAAMVPVPSGAVSSFTAGATFPGRRVPGEPNAIAVDWSAAGVAA